MKTCFESHPAASRESPLCTLSTRPSQAVIELTYNWGQDAAYELGNAFGHLAIAVPDAAAACDTVRAGGGKVAREAGPVQHGTTVIAFVEDPDGYKIELIERKG